MARRLPCRQAAASSEAGSGLQAHVDKFIELIGLPTTWKGDPEAALGKLLEALVQMLHLDWAGARLYDVGDQGAIQLIRTNGTGPHGPDARRAIERLLAHGPGSVPGRDEASPALFRLDAEGRHGLLAAAAPRTDFPSSTESLLLRVAASKVLLGVLEARRQRERERVQTLLEQRAMRQSSQLVTLAAELRQERAEHRRSDEERLALAAVVDHSPDFIAVCSLGGLLLHVNPAGQQLLGLQLVEARGRLRLAECFMEPERQAVDTHVLPAVLKDGQWDGEMRLRHFASGAPIPVLQHVFSIRDAENSPLAVATTCRDITRRKQTEDALVVLKDELSAELSALALLHELSTRWLARDETLPLLEEVLEATMALLGADFGNVQLHDPESGTLRIVAQRGFEREFLDHFASVPAGTGACGTALAQRARVVCDDVSADPSFAPHLKIMSAAGVRAVQSTPLLGRSGEPLGVLSTHFRKPHRPAERELRMADLYAHVAGQMIERDQSQSRLRGAFDEIASLKERLAREKLYLEEEIKRERGFETIVGESPALTAVLRLVETVAPTTSTVLIEGETGTGKELLARAIHERSRRSRRTFVKVCCAAMPAGLLESELFGHEKGAFTGAVAQRIGRFELADQGTIFLDEIGELPLELQTKLLRVLQERELERVGGSRTIKVDVRLIAATNRSLREMVAEGSFRDDLYYRLNVFPIVAPPLRERTEDIPALVRHFVKRHAARMSKSISEIPAGLMRALCEHCWPGNVRELENFIERSVILSRRAVLEAPLYELARGTLGIERRARLASCEREQILEALEACDWVLAGPRGAAARLGVKRTSLQYRIKLLGIVRPH